jgi:uncharacterized glyoxalase superfamily protein PhnB
MPADPPSNTPRITPYLLYEDLDGAIEWLGKCFGFAERHRMPGPDGKVTHAEMSLADGVVMMGHPGPEYQNPKRLGHVCQLVYVYVDDVDSHYEHARAAGASILSEPEDKPYGDRTYAAEDPEGHRWYFAQHIR